MEAITMEMVDTSTIVDTPTLEQDNGDLFRYNCCVGTNTLALQQYGKGLLGHVFALHDFV
jgi:hypothetical protein